MVGNTKTMPMYDLLSFADCNESCDIKADWLSMSGHITPLDCDQDGFYDYNLRCTWTITGEFYLEIKIQIDELDIQETENCISDYVQVNIFIIIGVVVRTPEFDARHIHNHKL